ncbi:hypothetical protein [Acaryochloris marina]|uniref:hypothetical protein n=1 Tax=Acaryochloris marina TaxID=155978 RepID=UPI00059EE030|nr:hypothetical protein [Acaryochloris marina]
MNKPGKIKVSHKPLTPSQERLCIRFIDTFGVSLFEIIDATFFSLRFNPFDFASVSFKDNGNSFTLSYGIDELNYGFMLCCNNEDRAFFPISNIFFF